MKNILKAIFTIIGAIIGAGFASGQEIYSFFNIYGENGILGISISCILLGIVIYKVLKKSNDYNITNYNKFLEVIKMPNRIKKILSVIINIFLIISFYIMVAGFTAYFKQEFDIPYTITVIIITFICYITFMKNIEGITFISTIIVPILIIIIFMLGIKSDLVNEIRQIDLENINISIDWISKSIQYASYNSILLIPILISLKKYTKNNEKKISTITTIIFWCLSIIIYIIMIRLKNIVNIEMPIVHIANKYGKLYKYTYGIAIIFSIYTTMISEGYSFLNNCANENKKYKMLAIILCASAIFISNLGFSNLINLTYPVFGILGTLQIIYLIITK